MNLFQLENKVVELEEKLSDVIEDNKRLSDVVEALREKTAEISVKIIEDKWAKEGFPRLFTKEKEPEEKEKTRSGKKKWISLPLAAEKLGVTHGQIGSFYRNGSLSSKKINNRIYVSLDEVECYKSVLGDYFTPSDAMDALGGIASSKLADLAKNGHIKTIKDPMRPKRYLYEKASIEKWLRFNDENELIG